MNREAAIRGLCMHAPISRSSNRVRGKIHCGGPLRVGYPDRTSNRGSPIPLLSLDRCSATMPQRAVSAGSCRPAQRPLWRQTCLPKRQTCPCQRYLAPQPKRLSVVSTELIRVGPTHLLTNRHRTSGRSRVACLCKTSRTNARTMKRLASPSLSSATFGWKNDLLVFRPFVVFADQTSVLLGDSQAPALGFSAWGPTRPFCHREQAAVVCT